MEWHRWTYLSWWVACRWILGSCTSNLYTKISDEADIWYICMHHTFLSTSSHYGDGLFTDYMEALENSGSRRTELSQYQRPAQGQKEGNKISYIFNNIVLLIMHDYLEFELDMFLFVKWCHWRLFFKFAFKLPIIRHSRVTLTVRWIIEIDG